MRTTRLFGWFLKHTARSRTREASAAGDLFAVAEIDVPAVTSEAVVVYTRTASSLRHTRRLCLLPGAVLGGGSLGWLAPS